MLLCCLPVIRVRASQLEGHSINNSPSHTKYFTTAPTTFSSGARHSQFVMCNHALTAIALPARWPRAT